MFILLVFFYFCGNGLRGSYGFGGLVFVSLVRAGDFEMFLCCFEYLCDGIMVEGVFYRKESTSVVPEIELEYIRLTEQPSSTNVEL